MSKGLIDILIDSIFDEKWRGQQGERLTEHELNWVKLFGRKGHVLRNVYLPKNNGETSEVDVIFICQKGIFIFESKNYSGWIFGDEESSQWTTCLPNGDKNRFYNPIKQNHTHLKWMRNFVGKEVPLFSIIVFSERCELKKVTVESPDIYVIKRDRTYATVRNIWDDSPDVLNKEQVESLTVRLKELTYVGDSVKREHIEAIERKYGNEEASVCDAQWRSIDEPDEPVETELFCPRCGGKLVKRTARRGANAGNQFWGCSNFPNCRYIQNLM